MVKGSRDVFSVGQKVTENFYHDEVVRLQLKTSWPASGMMYGQVASDRPLYEVSTVYHCNYGLWLVAAWAELLNGDVPDCYAYVTDLRLETWVCKSFVWEERYRSQIRQFSIWHIGRIKTEKQLLSASSRSSKPCWSGLCQNWREAHKLLWNAKSDKKKDCQLRIIDCQ